MDSKKDKKTEEVSVEEAKKEEEEAPESKLSLAQLKKEFAKMGCNYNETFAKVKDVIVKTVLAAESPILQ